MDKAEALRSIRYELVEYIQKKVKLCNSKSYWMGVCRNYSPCPLKSFLRSSALSRINNPLKQQACT